MGFQELNVAVATASSYCEPPHVIYKAGEI